MTQHVGVPGVLWLPHKVANSLSQAMYVAGLTRDQY